MFVSAGSASTHATSPCASSRSSASTSLNSTTRVVSSSGTGGPRFPSRATTCAVAQRRERLVDRAVVAPVEDQHLRPSGDEPGEPHREAVRVGRGQRELPQRQAEAPRQLLADPERVLARQHQRDPARRLRGDRARDGRGRVAGHRARVAQAEVDVLVARRRRGSARRSLDREDGEAAGPAHHPVHRHAARAASAAPAAQARANAGGSRSNSSSSRSSRAAARSFIVRRPSPFFFFFFPPLDVHAVLRLREHLAERAGDLVDLAVPGDERRRDLDHRVAPVVGAADQPVLEQLRGQEAADQRLALFVGEPAACRLVLDQLSA